MFAARLACVRGLFGPTQSFGAAAFRNSTVKNSQWLLQCNQSYATKTRFGMRHAKSAREEVKKTAYEQGAATRIDLTGRLIVAGGASVALGALCYYGLGMSNEVGAVEKAVVWPQYVKDRIRSTYMYFAGSIGLTALSAVAVSRSPTLMSLMMRGSWLAIGATFATMIGVGMLVRSISYDQSPGAKHLSWMLHAGVMGAVIAPLTLLGGPLLVRAAWYTAGIIGGLSTVAMCAPSEKFLNMGGPLGVGLGLVLASSIGTAFFPATSAFGAGLYSIAVYGGLVLFGMFLLYDTQKVIKRAEMTPLNGMVKFDPINSCLGIYTDTLNIFIRVAMMLAGGGGSRRK